MAKLIISKDQLEKVISHCKFVYPNEACGLLAGKNNIVRKIYEMTNIEKSRISYLMDSMEQFSVMKQMREEHNDMIAIYHSHPDSPAYPSVRDINLAFYSDAAYIIVSLSVIDMPEVKAFEIVEGRVNEIELDIRNGG